MTNLPKFRAWHKELKEMFKIYSLNFSSENLEQIIIGNNNRLVAAKPGEIELMQWTGLQDKNCKDIYEGDIIQYEYEDEFGNITYPKVLIKWKHEYAGFRAYDIPDIHGVCDVVSWVCYNPTQIIGNIYENRELLDANRS